RSRRERRTCANACRSAGAGESRRSRTRPCSWHRTMLPTSPAPSFMSMAAFWRSEGDQAMTYSLDAFCEDCRTALKTDHGPGGREAVRQNLERLPAETAFPDKHVLSAPPGRHTLY